MTSPEDLQRQHVRLRRIAEGALAGALATVPMSVAMLVAQRLGLMGQQPPEKITNAALETADIHPSSTGRRALTGAAHLAFGAGAGAVFSMLRTRRQTAARAVAEGVGYGTTVWAASYAGWVPALGIMPRPSEDRRGRPASMVVAHWVFGTALALLLRGLRRER